MSLNAIACLLLVFIATALVWRDVTQILLHKLQTERSFQHITFAIIVVFWALWSAEAGVKPGLSIHFLGLTSLTLMYGWRSAFALSLPITLLMSLLGPLTWANVPEFLVFSALIPILMSYGVFLVSYHYLPRNIFVFIFIAGFLNGALTGSVHLLINSLYYLFVTEYDWQTIYNNYLMFTPLLAFPEGLINGMAAAMLTVFKPELLRVFSDRDYIYNHYHNNDR
ncbi:hypothetical protein FCU94_08385 [Vibrio sp. JPW-9-11-11]|uniref:energy-coupling factor ABC transporter permease n=1 Tax=Vibrio sp. JPW-9-11-11 TaxID=1416532 RepID=UPI0015931069|nr:energy-coupling factor ABC transporter permease [Vibrio sp. JPW-9-11-11]NVD06929.1 hypothetical protein [Vibrio sp. JPW-9-11-11]